MIQIEKKVFINEQQIVKVEFQIISATVFLSNGEELQVSEQEPVNVLKTLCGYADENTQSGGYEPGVPY